jgi:exodeoxyribonuclease III
MVKIATVNVNGIRAAARKDMADWLKVSSPDVLCLQEVRAPRQDLVELSTTGPLATKKWQIFDHEATAKGRAGVALLTELTTLGSRVELGPTEFDSAGRWLEVDIETKAGTLTVVSTYVHSGEADTPKQVEKYKFLEAMRARMAELARDDRLAVVVGDLNVGHTELDIKNWKGNIKNAGFLPEERAYFDDFATQGWVDIGRHFHPETPGPYTWWSYRGKAFDTDAGWRIDYQLATPKLAERAKTYQVDRAISYDARWSDHSPVVVGYDL